MDYAGFRNELRKSRGGFISPEIHLDRTSDASAAGDIGKF